MPDVIETTAREDGEDEPTPSTEVEPVQRADDPRDLAVAQAAEQALAMPGVPGRDEFLSLAMQARMLSMSGAAPKEVRNSPYVAFHVAMVGRDLGISPSAAMELIDVIPGRGDRGPQLSLSPQLMNGQIRRLGLGEIVKGESTALACTAIAVGPGGRDRRCRLRWPDHVDDCECDILGVGTFTWEDARMADLVGADCQPGQHKRGSGNNGRCRCNQGYITYPQRMLWWRASGYLADDVFPEAGLGLYSPEELGAITDDTGRLIDVASVELPQGYEPVAVDRPTADDPADPDELWDFQARLHGLPEAQQADWRQLKVNQERLRGTPSHAMSASQLRLAKSVIGGLESAAKRSDDGYNPELAAEGAKLRAFAGAVEVLTAWHAHDEPAAEIPDVPEFDVDGDGQGEPDPSADVSAEAGLQVPVPDSGAATPPEEPAGQPAAKERPTVADVTAIRDNLEAIVKKMTVGQVRQDLVEYQLDATGTAPEARKRLLDHLVTVEITKEITK